MTESPPDLAQERTSRKLKIALILSLGLNLIILGVIGGAIIHGGPDGKGPRFRDVGFGPFTEALTQEDRTALRRSFVQEGGNPREMRREMREGFAEMLAALRAQPFDAERLRTVVASMQSRMQSRIDMGQSLLTDRIVAMTPQERLGFADRLEETMKRGPKPKEPPPEG